MSLKSSSLQDGKFKATIAVLQRLGNRFEFVFEKLKSSLGDEENCQENCAVSSVDLNLNESIEPIQVDVIENVPKQLADDVPNLQQLEIAASKIHKSLDWPTFVSRMKSIDVEFDLKLFDPSDHLLTADIEFVDLKLRFPLGLPPTVACTPSFLRAAFARKIEKIEGCFFTCENKVDDEILPPDFHYVKSNVYTEDVPSSALQAVVGCSCVKCSEDSYCCPNQAQVDFAYKTDEANNRKILQDVNSVQAIYECTSLCRCSSMCLNRVVQQGLRIPLLLFKTQNRGWGIKTLRDICKGEFVIEYVGQVISKKSSSQVCDVRARSYMFNIDFNIECKAAFVISAVYHGNLARFINSRCGDANLIAHAVYIDCVHRDLPRIAFFARRDILAEEELTFDYFDGLPQAQSCLCRSIFCRETLRQAPRLTAISSPTSSSSSLASVHHKSASILSEPLSSAFEGPIDDFSFLDRCNDLNESCVFDSLSGLFESSTALQDPKQKIEPISSCCNDNGAVISLSSSSSSSSVQVVKDEPSTSSVPTRNLQQLDSSSLGGCENPVTISSSSSASSVSRCGGGYESDGDQDIFFRAN